MNLSESRFLVRSGLGVRGVENFGIPAPRCSGAEMPTSPSHDPVMAGVSVPQTSRGFHDLLELFHLGELSNVFYKLLRCKTTHHSGRHLTAGCCINLLEAVVLHSQIYVRALETHCDFKLHLKGWAAKLGLWGTFVAYPFLFQGLAVGGIAKFGSSSPNAPAAGLGEGTVGLHARCVGLNATAIGSNDGSVGPNAMALDPTAALLATTLAPLGPTPVSMASTAVTLDPCFPS